MTNEEKELLIRDLCARLPYDVKCVTKDGIESPLIHKGEAEFDFLTSINYRIEKFGLKPYLRPMSSMTEEELNECVCQSGIKDIECPNWQDISKEKQFEARLNHAIAVFFTDSNNVDWLNKKMFDYRGLIPMGLAFPAPEGMYNI